MYIHKHPCESKLKFINMESLSSILQGCIQPKKKSSRIPIFPKIHKRTGQIACLYPKYWSWSYKNLNKHVIVVMKLPNPSVKIRYRSFPCLTNISPWLKGTFWLRSRQWSSTIGSANIKIHREDYLFDYMPRTYYHTW